MRRSQSKKQYCAPEAVPASADAGVGCRVLRGKLSSHGMSRSRLRELLHRASTHGNSLVRITPSLVCQRPETPRCPAAFSLTLCPSLLILNMLTFHCCPVECLQSNFSSDRVWKVLLHCGTWSSASSLTLISTLFDLCGVS